MNNPLPDEIPLYVPFTSFDQIIKFPSNLNFRVYYLEAPISILSQNVLSQDILNDIIDINIFHSGIGFQSTDINNPIEFTLDYNIINGLNITSLFPTIIQSPNGDENLIWNNEAAPFIGNHIDRDYWFQSKYIATISSSQLHNIEKWVLQSWIPQNPIYVLFSGSKSNKRESLFNPFMRSSDCYDFAYFMIEFMKDSLKICIDYATVPNITIATFISSFPGSIVPVSFEENKNDIIEFYRNVNIFIQNIIDIQANIQECIKENSSSLTLYAIENDLFVITQLYDDIYNTFNIIYVFGYLPDGSIGYWKITNPNPLIDYIKINIKRSYRSIDLEGNSVTDSFSDIIPTCKTTKNTSNILFIILFIIVIFIMIVLIFYFVFYYKNNENNTNNIYMYNKYNDKSMYM
uniref:Uncharacterized protein n=1 Tax=Pithovirus LCPAC102 TaxID=2506587 RepID=A0A4D5XF88_9VIRU|nr:MAG: hypothetical protein LCPAC102_01820 [Pithovirus LCPAC102]